MKFAAVVLMALAVAAEASYIPYAYHGYASAPVVTYSGHYGPTVVQSNNGWAAHAPVISAYGNHWNVPTAVTYDDGHYYNNYHGYLAAPVQHSASYVAANRGAVHKAPLAGHVVNQKSLNLAPAPGTL